ncbi:MAG TPA: nucleotide exchange factor GrpE [Rikenellaceae bacterium]|nr:nucleotide exchange factor GrpE [Rikenellaceae bacterium]
MSAILLLADNLISLQSLRTVSPPSRVFVFEIKENYDMSKKNKENRNKVQEEPRNTANAAEKAEEVEKEATECKENDKEAPEVDEEAKKIEEKLAKLLKENEELKASVAKEKDDYIRLMADFENFRRHSAEAKLELVASASADTIKGLLPVLDDCERAMKMLETSADEVAKEGTALIFNKLMSYLKSKGLEAIKAKGEKFDTDFHEAVAQFPVQEEDKKGLVYDVVQTGYTLGGKVIRYAKVVVAI